MLTYPMTVPVADWLYLCVAKATNRTPNMREVAKTGVVKNDNQMYFLESELTLTMENGNASMNRFYDWVRSNRSFQTVDDGLNDVIGL